MQGNPFYIDPFGGYGGQIVEGLSGLGAVLGERQRLKEEQIQEQEDLQEMQNLVRSGQPGQVADFILRKPKLAERLTTSVTYLNDQTQQNAYDTLKKIEMGADPVAALSERLMFLKQNGADPTDTIEELQQAMDNPEQYIQTVGKKREMLFPTRYLQDLKVENEKRRLQQGADGDVMFQQGTGPVAGYVFNPKTGQYTAAFPEGQMPTRDTRTATQKDFEYIQELRDQGMNDEADALAIKLKIRQPGSPEMAAAEATFDRENVEATFDRSISTINDILTDPLLEGTGYWRVLSRSLPLSDARAFEGKIRVLQSQAFLNEIEKMKGLGALSEMEGKKVADAVANLDGLQDNKDLRKQITIALNVFQQGKERAMKKLKVQEEQARKKLKSPSSNDQAPSGFSESSLEAAAKARGITVEQLRKVLSQ